MKDKPINITNNDWDLLKMQEQEMLSYLSILSLRLDNLK